ncbi:MAG: amidohydrolase family protein [Leifsonia sp.]
MIIDSHLHVWDRTRAEYAWLGPDLPEIDRDISLEEVLPQLDSADIAGVVLVQSADEPGDTDNMLAVAASNQRVLGVVGWAPLENPREAEARLKSLRENPSIVGIRNLIHDRPDEDWTLRPDFDAGLSILADVGLPFDFVTSGPDALSRLAIIAPRHPDLHIVLDHLGKPPIAGTGEELSEWTRLIEEVAQFPNVYAKVSGLYASTGTPQSWTKDQVSTAIAIAHDAFGASRLMYGGDWPVSTMAGGYKRVFDAITAAVSDWPATDKEAVFGRTAAGFYGLPII